MTYRDKMEAAAQASKEYQLSTGIELTFAEAEEFRAAYIEGLEMEEQLIRASLTVAEQAYLMQGYTLPTGWDWDKVHRMRSVYGLEDYAVPLAIAPFVVCWGVPYTRGQAMTH